MKIMNKTNHFCYKLPEFVKRIREHLLLLLLSLLLLLLLLLLLSLFAVDNQNTVHL